MLARKFDKEKFAGLLNKAMGDRSINQFALHSGISATYISKLLRKLVDKAPMPPTIESLSSKAYNGVTYEDLMVAAGHLNSTAIDAYAEAISTFDEIQKEIIIAKESGIEIDYETAQRMVQNRKRFLQQEKQPTQEEYVLSAPALPEALTRIAGLLKRGSVDIEIADHLSDLAFEKFGIPQLVDDEETCTYEEASHYEIDTHGTNKGDKNGKRR